MPVRCYYQNQAGVVGPVSVAELQYLINAGTIDGSTLARKGQDGPWLAADKIVGLLRAADEDAGADNSASEVPEWHFNPKGQNKQGPVPWNFLKAMLVEEKLQSDDLVWKPGMALWIQASQVPGLMAASADTRVPEPSLWTMLLRARALWAGVAATVLLGLIAAAGWKWTHTESTDRFNTRISRAQALTENGGRLKAGLGPVEQLLEDARSAVRVDQLDRATRLLEQYLASPVAEQGDAAKVLLRDINRVGSVLEAARLAQDLSDETLKEYLRNGVDTLLAALETPELRPTYERTILQAFRQENNRRQMIPRGAIAQNPNPVEVAPIPKDQEPDRVADAAQEGPVEPPRLSILGPAGPAGPAAGGNPDPKNNDVRLPRRPGLIPADIDYVLAKPGEFAGNTLVLNGLFKIGTKITEVKGPDRQVLGSSLPIARNDDATVCSADGKVGPNNTYLLLDDRLAGFLEHVFNKLGLRPTTPPSYKCILTVTTRRLIINGTPTPVVIISSIEVLGGCNYLSVARHQYSQAFRTLTVTAEEADVDFGDGDLWVERLGGEEDFVQPIRRKFREMQRRAVTNRDSAVLDRILQRDLAKIANTAAAINQIVAMEGLRRMRIWP